MPKKYYLQVASPLGKEIHTTKSYWDYIANQKHPEVKNKQSLAIETIRNPAIIKQSPVDEKVFLYYLKIKNKYFCVVAKHLDGEGFVITAYITKRIIKGELIWQKPEK